MSPSTAAVLATLCAGTAASAPPIVNAEGVLRNLAGEPVSGTFAMHIAIVDAPVDGKTLFEETLLDVPVANGRFALALGETEKLDAGIFATHDALWVAVQVAGSPPLPRQPFRSVPWALAAGHAGVADTVISAAPGLACSGCVGPAELGVAWALGASPGGAALDLACSGCIDGGEVASGAVALVHLAPDSVDGSKIVDGSVGLADLAPDSVDGSKVVDGSLTGADLADGTIPSAKLAPGAGGLDEQSITIFSLAEPFQTNASYEASPPGAVVTGTGRTNNAGFSAPAFDLILDPAKFKDVPVAFEAVLMDGNVYTTQVALYNETDGVTAGGVVVAWYDQARTARSGPYFLQGSGPKRYTVRLGTQGGGYPGYVWRARLIFRPAMGSCGNWGETACPGG